MKHFCCIITLSCLCFLVVPRGLCAEEAPNAKGDSRIDELLDRFSMKRGDEQKREEVVEQLLALPSSELESYLQQVFDPQADPLFAPEADERPTEERLEQLNKRRQRILVLVAEMGTSTGTRLLNAGLRNLPLAQQKEMARFLDHVCEQIRPEVFRRALKVTGGKLRDTVIRHIARIRDLRLIDAVMPLLEIEESRASNSILVLLQSAAGQRNLMRKFIDARAGGDTTATAYGYARKVGDHEYAAAAAISCIKECEETSVARETARALGRINIPRARKAVVQLLQDDAMWSEFKDVLSRYPPDFFAEERIPFFLQFYRERPKYGPGSFLRWLQKNGSTAGVETAHTAFQQGTYWPKDSEQVYLLWCGNTHTLNRVEAQARGANPKLQNHAISNLLKAGVWDEIPEDVVQQFATAAQLGGPEACGGAMYMLIDQGLWDRLPGNLEERLAHAAGKYDRPDYYPGLILRQAALQNAPESLPVLRLIAENAGLELRARTLMLKVGDRSVIPRLKELMSFKRALERVPAAAALYEAGQGDQLEELLAALKAAWLPVKVRVLAAAALADSPDELKRAAAQALAEALLDRSGDVSEAAYNALCEMSGLEDLAFNPWADDATRKKQAGPLLEWVRALE